VTAAARPDLVLATDSGVVVCRAAEPGGWQVVRRGLADQAATSVISREGVILAGTRAGVFRSDDLGASWRSASRGLDEPYVRWLAFHPAVSDLELAGTEPAGIFVSTDGAASWRGCPEVTALRDALGWWLPYSPADGCVRGFAVQGRRAYAAVEVGGVLRSDDGGSTWRLASGPAPDEAAGAAGSGAVHSDVHSVVVHPSDDDLVFAATQAGLYRSGDGGGRWEPIGPGYTRAAWVDPRDAGHIVAGPARGVDRLGTIVRTRDGGASWQSAVDGLDTPWPATMVERFTVAGEELLALLSDGRLYAAPPATLAWRQVLAEVGGVRAVAAAARIGGGGTGLSGTGLPA
jgi:photosystem II stability/assembly factor-like uncharacterized protein